jgi:hypothetical protein
MPRIRTDKRSTKGSNGLHPHYHQPPHVPTSTVNAYLRVVAEHFGTTVGRLLAQRIHGGGPPGTLPIQRQVAIYLLRRNTGIHLDILAGRFKRSRTTIIRSITLVERKLEAKAHSYVEAVNLIGMALARARLAGCCDRCGRDCTPGPLCFECDTLVSGQTTLTNGGAKPKLFHSDRDAGADRINTPRTPPDPKAKPPAKRSDLTGGFKSRR